MIIVQNLSEVLDLQPIRKFYQLENFENELKASHKISGSIGGLLGGGNELAALVVVALLVLRDFQVYGVNDVLAHEAVPYERAVLTYQVLQSLLVQLAHSKILTPAAHEAANDILQVFRHVQRALQQVAEREQTLVLTLFTVSFFKMRAVGMYY